MNLYSVIFIFALVNSTALCKGAQNKKLPVVTQKDWELSGEHRFQYTQQDLEKTNQTAELIISKCLKLGTEEENLCELLKLQKMFQRISIEKSSLDIWFACKAYKILKKNKIFNPELNLNDFILVEIIKTYASSEIYIEQRGSAAVQKILSLEEFLHKETNSKWKNFLALKNIDSVKKIDFPLIFTYLTEFKKINSDIFKKEFFPE